MPWRTVSGCGRHLGEIRERNEKKRKLRVGKTKSGQNQEWARSLCFLPWELVTHMEFLRELIKHRKWAFGAWHATEDCIIIHIWRTPRETKRTYVPNQVVEQVEQDKENTPSTSRSSEATSPL